MFNKLSVFEMICDGCKFRQRAEKKGEDEAKAHLKEQGWHQDVSGQHFCTGCVRNLRHVPTPKYQSGDIVKIPKGLLIFSDMIFVLIETYPEEHSVWRCVAIRGGRGVYRINEELTLDRGQIISQEELYKSKTEPKS